MSDGDLFRVGDVVRLKGSMVEMTIEGIAGPLDSIEVVWFTAAHELRRDVINRRLIVRLPWKE